MASRGVSTARCGWKYNIERALVRKHGQALAAAVLVVAHHGSRSASSAEFIDAVAPDLALFSSGYRNRYGHPNSDVVERFHERGVSTLTTADTGAVTVRLTSAGLDPEVQLHRLISPRPWHWQPAFSD